jgi:hypothetical protein
VMATRYKKRLAIPREYLLQAGVSTNFRSSHVRTRLQNAIEHLATSNDKLRERVLDAYEYYLSILMPKEFPDQKTRQTFEAIKTKVRAIRDRIEQRPGAYESLLHNKLLSPHEIAKRTLDYRVARELAKLIASLYFEVEAWVLDEYERELAEEKSGILNRARKMRAE